MTRRIRDREQLKREVETSKRVLERARPWTERGRGAPTWPGKLGERPAPPPSHPQKR